MNLGTLLKWGAILLVVYIAWQWVSNNLLAANQSIPDTQWAPPLYRPYWGAGPWADMWQPNYLNIGRGPRRGRGRGPWRGPRPY
jgi:hypothetical protein